MPSCDDSRGNRRNVLCRPNGHGGVVARREKGNFDKCAVRTGVHALALFDQGSASRSKGDKDGCTMVRTE